MSIPILYFSGSSQNISCVNRGGKGFAFSNGKCYYISSDPANILSWFEARKDCINKNGDLATIDSKQTKRTIDAMIKGAGITTTCWLGLTSSALNWTTGMYHIIRYRMVHISGMIVIDVNETEHNDINGSTDQLTFCASSAECLYNMPFCLLAVIHIKCVAIRCKMPRHAVCSNSQGSRKLGFI